MVIITFLSNSINIVGYFKEDIMALFVAFHNCNLDVQRLNYGIRTLLSKNSEANKIQQFKFICLLRCIYKLITKILTLRLDPYAEKLFGIHQNTFIKGSNIMYGIVSPHELLHHTHVRKHTRVISKLDFEKAYDKVNWDFLPDCHRARGFSDLWYFWTHQFFHNGVVSEEAKQ
jgi:hypothetical protein